MESERETVRATRQRGEPARILILDDHPMVREGLAELINARNDLTCCGAVGSVPEAEAALTTQRPDLLLLDLRLGRADGLKLIKSLKARFPELRILVVSQLDELIYAERALRAGALGYVMKEHAAEEVLSAIRAVLAGHIHVSARITEIAVQSWLSGHSHRAGGRADRV